MSLSRFSVPAISCEHCVAAISGEVSAVPGVVSVVVSIDDKTVTVQGDAGPDSIAVAIEEAGYDVAGEPRILDDETADGRERHGR